MSEACRQTRRPDRDRVPAVGAIDQTHQTAHPNPIAELRVTADQLQHVLARMAPARTRDLRRVANRDAFETGANPKKGVALKLVRIARSSRDRLQGLDCQLTVRFRADLRWCARPDERADPAQHRPAKQ